MKTWFSAAELAALELPALPARRESIIRLAAREGWNNHPTQCRTRAGRGGGFEYSIELLPADARAEYIARHVEMVEVPATVAREAATESGAALLGGRAAQARDARLAVLTLADRYAADAKLSRKIADGHFCERYNAGALHVARWIATEVKSIAPRTLARWRRLAADGQRTKLAVDRGASRRGTGQLDRAGQGEVKTYLLALIAKQPQLTAHHLSAIAADRFPDLQLPPVRTFQRALKIWREEYRNELLAIRDPDGFKSKVRFAARVAQPAMRLNELWQIDASPADVLTTDGRYSLYLCEDIFSRRLIGLVTKTPRAAAVALLLRKAIKAWGVPERVKTDNGSDFVARETQRFFAALAIEHEKSAPFSPEQKGHIERAIGTLQRGLMRTLEGFIGHSVADRKVIEGRKSFARRLGEAPEDMFEVALSATDLQARIDEWCSVVYGHAPHAGLKGHSPFAVAATAGGQVRRVDDDRALDMLLMPVAGKDGCRTVTKSGLRIDGTTYLAGFLNVGDVVHVRMDPADMGRAYVFSADALTFLGEALAPDLLGIDPAEAIARARAEQKRIISERTAAMKAEARKIKAKDFASAIHRQAAKNAGTLVEFPKATLAHDTPALAAARAAADRDDEAPVHSPEVVALSARLQAEAAQQDNDKVTPLRREETPHQRWQRACALERALSLGADLSADDALWLGGYRSGPEYRGFALTYGEAATQSPVEQGREVAS